MTGMTIEQELFMLRVQRHLTIAGKRTTGRSTSTTLAVPDPAWIRLDWPGRDEARVSDAVTVGS